MSTPNSIAEPQIKYLYQLLDQIEKGRLFVPKFQRCFIWKDEQRLELLQSIKLGIPIGSFLVWETTQYRLATLKKIGGIQVPKIPEPTPGVPRTYLLDGHQRLSTLFGTLKRPVNEALENKANIVDDVDWRIYYDLKNEEFILQLRQQPKPTWMPLNLLLDSLALLKFSRQLTNDELIQRADQLSRTFTSYKIALVTIETDRLEYATTAFQRINSSGTRMNDVDMLSALSWTEQFDLKEKIAGVQEKLAEVGWQRLDEKVILSACRTILGLELYKANVEETCSKLKDNPTLFDEVATDFIQVAQFLQKCGIDTPQMLPYSYQSVLLLEAIRENPSFNAHISQRLKDWLWRTAYTETFSGINETNMQRALDNILSIAQGDVYNRVKLKEKIAPMPKQFKFKSSRAKLLVLRLAELKPQNINGETLKVRELLGLQGRYVVLRLISRYLSATENCFIVEPQKFSEFRNYLLNPTATWPPHFLRSHAISDTAAQALKQGNYERFLSERRNTLIELEKSFIQPLGLDYDDPE